MAVLKALENCIKRKKFIEKNETVRMERELDGKTKAYHFPESGWEESA